MDAKTLQGLGLEPVAQPFDSGPGQGLSDPQSVVGSKPLVDLREGGQSFERTITITDERLNGGRPTNIPTIWDGQQLSDEEAIGAAAGSGLSYPAYESVDLAVAAAQERSQALGSAAGMGGPQAPTAPRQLELDLSSLGLEPIGPGQPSRDPKRSSDEGGGALSWLGDMAGQAGLGVVETGGMALSGTEVMAEALWGGAQRLLGNENPSQITYGPGWLQQWGNAIYDWANSQGRAADGLDEEIARAVGQLGTFIGLALVPGGLYAAGGAGVAIAADEQYRMAVEHGADPDVVDLATTLGGATGLSDLIPLEVMLSGAFGGKGGKIVGALKYIAASVTAEAGQEAAQGFTQDLIAQQLYDPDREFEATQYLREGGIAGAAAGIWATLLAPWVGDGRRAREIVERAREEAIADGREDLVQAEADVAPTEAPNVAPAAQQPRRETETEVVSTDPNAAASVEGQPAAVAAELPDAPPAARQADATAEAVGQGLPEAGSRVRVLDANSGQAVAEGRVESYLPDQPGGSLASVRLLTPEDSTLELPVSAVTLEPIDQPAPSVEPPQQPPPQQPPVSRETVGAPRPTMRRPNERLAEFVARIGGIDDADPTFRGEGRHAGLDQWHRTASGGIRPFVRRLLRDRQDGGQSLDYLAEQAAEAGYIPERDPVALIDALRREVDGDPVYSDQDLTAAQDAEAMRLYQRGQDELADRLGIDRSALDAMSPQDLQSAMREAGLTAASAEPGTADRTADFLEQQVLLLRPEVERIGPDIEDVAIQRLVNETLAMSGSDLDLQMQPRAPPDAGFDATFDAPTNQREAETDGQPTPRVPEPETPSEPEPAEVSGAAGERPTPERQPEAEDGAGAEPAARRGEAAPEGDQRGLDGQVLADAGLTVAETTTNNGNPVWEIGGKSYENRELLKRLGGRFYRRKKVWSFYDGDPSAKIAEALRGEPATEQTDQGEQLVVPGAEQDEAGANQRRADAPIQPEREQKGVDGLGLFDPTARETAQGDLLARPEALGLEPVEAAAAAAHDTEGAESPTSENALAQAFSERLLAGDGFASIVEARRFAAEVQGGQASDLDRKALDEAIEYGVVLAARQIVAEGRSAAETYRRLVQLYGDQPKLQERTSDSIERQAYSTPVPLSYLASRAAGVEAAATVYEPSAGQGALLIEADPSKVTANEIDGQRSASLREQGFEVTNEDASSWSPDGSFEVVIANPPFGPVRGDDGRPRVFDLDGLKTREIDHGIVWSALKRMKPDGRAVLIIGGKRGSTDERRRSYRADKVRAFFKKLYDGYNVVQHITVDGKLYDRQGAGWPVDMIVIDGQSASALHMPMKEPPPVYQSWDELRSLLDDDSMGAARELHGSGRDPAGAGAQQTDAERVPAAAGGADRPARGSGEPGRGDAPATDGRRAGEPVSGRRADDGGRDPGREQRVAEGEGSLPDATGPSLEDQARSRRRAGAGERDAGGVPKPPVPRRLKRQNTEAETAFQVQYEPTSNARFAVGTLVPRNMQAALSRALEDLGQRVGSIDAYVAQKLGYKLGELTGTAKKPGYFSAEQVDALALAIDNVERGAGFIIGDQTGVGKGRFVAGMLRYAQVAGKVPIFITKDPALYGDMVRDLRDIGMKDVGSRILVTNTDLRGGKAVPLSPDDPNDTLMSMPPAKQKAVMAEIAKTGKLPAGYDFLFTTYSQLQYGPRGAELDRQRAVMALAPGAVVVPDESHEAGGTDSKKYNPETGEEIPSRADFVRNLIGEADGAVYSSATYAKNPTVMDLYFKTDLSAAVENLDQLAETIQAGGVPLQQVVANMLVEAGQYARRERSYEGVKMTLDEIPVDKKVAVRASNTLRQIFSLDTDYLEEARQAWINAIEEGGYKGGRDASVGEQSATQTGFAQIMHNIVSQMLLSLKAPGVVDRAIALAKGGEKPIIALSNTNEAILTDFIEDKGLRPGQAADLTFNTILERYVRRLRRITFKSEHGEKFHQFMDDEQVRIYGGQSALDELRRVERLAREVDLADMPASPVDYIIDRMEAAGIKTGEITGRGVRIREGVFEVRKASSAEKKRVVNDYNSGALDGLVINRSGSTGLSMHATDQKGNDGKPRHMLILQADPNIDTFMQMLGRIHRTGQIKLPSYTIASSDLAVEKRPAAVLMKKMASLNANTTAAKGSAVSLDQVTDFLNPYGDDVVKDYLQENTEIATLTNLQEGGQNLAAKLTGRLAIAEPEKVARIYEDIEANYRDYVDALDRMGLNTLEAKTLDLDARTISTMELEAAKGEGIGPFEEAATVEMVDVRRLGRAMTLEELDAEVAKALGEETADQRARAQRAQLDALLPNYLQRMDEGIERHKAAKATAKTKAQKGRAEEAEKAWVASKAAARERLGKIKEAVSNLRPGASMVLTLTQDISADGEGGETLSHKVHAVSLGASLKRLRDNPTAASAIKVRFALADAGREVTLPLSKLIGHSPSYGYDLVRSGPVRKSFEEGGQELRETREIITGNLLSGFAKFKRGQIVMYTDDEGRTRRGILLPRDFNAETRMGQLPVRFETAEQVVRFLGDGTEPRMVMTSDGVLAITPEEGTGHLSLAVKTKGGKPYYLNRAVRSLIGDFKQRRGQKVMRATASRAQLAEIMEIYRENLGSTFETSAHREEARQIVGTEAPQHRKYAVKRGGPRFVKIDTGPIFGSDKSRKKRLERGRRAAMAHIGKSFRNADTQRTIRVTRGGMLHTLNQAREPLVAAAVRLPDLLRVALHVGSEPDRRGRPDIKAVHTFQAQAEIDGIGHTANITVFEASDGNLFYDLAVFEDGGGDPAQGTEGETQVRHPYPSGAADPKIGDRGGRRKPAMAEGTLGGSTAADVSSIVSAVVDELRRVAPGADLRVLPSFRAEGPGAEASGGQPGDFAAGAYLNGLIEFAYTAVETPGQARGVAGHEAIHFLRDRGFFSDAEWKLLEREAQRRWIAEYGLPESGDPAVVEEAIAYRYQDWVQEPGRTHVGARRVFERIRQFFERLVKALRGQKYQSANDVFRKVYEGEVGRRFANGAQVDRDGRAYAVEGGRGGGARSVMPKQSPRQVHSPTGPTTFNRADLVALAQEFIRRVEQWGPAYGASLDVAKGGSVYVVVQKHTQMKKDGTPAKNSRLMAASPGFKARFADHAAYHGATISVDPVSANSIDDVERLARHVVLNEGPSPTFTVSRIDPEAGAQFVAEATYDRNSTVTPIKLTSGERRYHALARQLDMTDAEMDRHVEAAEADLAKLRKYSVAERVRSVRSRARGLNRRLLETAGPTPARNVEVVKPEAQQDINPITRRLYTPDSAFRGSPVLQKYVRQSSRRMQELQSSLSRLTRDWDTATRKLSETELSDLSFVLFRGDARGETYSAEDLRNLTDENGQRLDLPAQVVESYLASRRLMEKTGRLVDQHERDMQAMLRYTVKPALLRKLAKLSPLGKAEVERLMARRSVLAAQIKGGAGDTVAAGADLHRITEDLVSGSDDLRGVLGELDMVEHRLSKGSVRRRQGYIPHKFYGSWRVNRIVMEPDEAGNTVETRRLEAPPGGQGFFDSRAAALAYANRLAEGEPTARFRVEPSSFRFTGPGGQQLPMWRYQKILDALQETTGMERDEVREAVSGTVRPRSRRRWAGFKQYRAGVEGYSQDLDRVIRTHLGEATRYVYLDKLKYQAVLLEEQLGLDPNRRDRQELTNAFRAYVRDVFGERQAAETSIDEFFDRYPGITPLRTGLAGGLAVGTLGGLFSGNPFVGLFLGGYLGYRFYHAHKQAASSGGMVARGLTGEVLGFTAHMKLGAFFNLFSPLVNLSQIALNTAAVVPYKYMGEGLADVGRAIGGNEDLRRLLARHNIDPVYKYSEINPHLFEKPSRLGMWSMFFFDGVERFNRAVTFMAGYRQAMAGAVKGVAKNNPGAAQRYGIGLVNRTQFDYSAAMKPELLRGTFLRVPLQFKNFLFQQIKFVAGLETRQEVGKFLLHMFLFAGALGLPGIQILDWLLETLFDWSPIDETKRLALEMAAEGELQGDIAFALAKGMPAFIGLDLSSRIGMGDRFLPQMAVDDLIGPFASTVQRSRRLASQEAGLTDQMRNLSAGLGAPLKALETAANGMPVESLVTNPAAFLEALWDDQAVYTSPYKRQRSETENLDDLDIVTIMVGGSPQRLARGYDFNAVVRAEMQRYDRRQTRYMNQIARAYRSFMPRDNARFSEEVQRIRQEALENDVVLSPMGIRRLVQTMNLSRDLRTLRDAPRALRPQILEMQRGLE